MGSKNPKEFKKKIAKMQDFFSELQIRKNGQQPTQQLKDCPKKKVMPCICAIGMTVATGFLQGGFWGVPDSFMFCDFYFLHNML